MRFPFLPPVFDWFEIDEYDFLEVYFIARFWFCQCRLQAREVWGRVPFLLELPVMMGLKSILMIWHSREMAVVFYGIDFSVLSCSSIMDSCSY